MTNIRIGTDFFRDPKTKKLERRLGNDGVLAVLQLFCWCAENRPDGDLAGMDDEDIALVSGWDGDDNETTFVNTLLKIRWLEHGPSKGFVLGKTDKIQVLP